mgnify:CR=1 FL=1
MSLDTKDKAKDKKVKASSKEEEASAEGVTDTGGTTDPEEVADAEAVDPGRLFDELVTVRQRIEVLDWKSPELELEITCGSGTYIRALARDLGVALGCGALMAELVRTRVGSFEITGAVSPDVLTAENLRDHLQPPLVAVAELSRQVCNDEEVVAIGHGRRVPCRVSRQDSEVQVALVDAAENLLAVAEVRPDTGELAPRHVFVGQ